MLGVTAHDKAALLALIKHHSDQRMHDTEGKFDDVTFTSSIHFNKAGADGKKWLYVFICKRDVEKKDSVGRTFTGACNKIWTFDEASITGTEKLCECGETIWKFEK